MQKLLQNPFSIIPAATALLGVVSLAVWFLLPTPALTLRVPVDDDFQGTALAADAVLVRVDLRGELTTGPGVASSIQGAWPQFRGPALDNVSREADPLKRNWPNDGPPVLWSVEVGEGYAGAAVHNGRVYVHDYDHDRLADAIRCLSLDDGREIWRHSYDVLIKRNHGMSRTVPAVTDRHVVSIGPMCHVVCLDAVTGEFQWGIDMPADYGTEVPPWYAGQCPLIDGERVILAPAGPDVLMTALDIETGATIWTTPNPRGWRMTHSSVVPMEIDGVKMYVYCGSGGVAGVSAEDGELLWDTTAWRISIANIPTPIHIGDGRVFLCGGYNAGAMMIEVSRSGDSWNVEELYRLNARQFGSGQQTPILFEGHIYGVIPDGQLVCIDLDGERLWASGTGHRFGLGPYMIADGMIFVMDDHGNMALAEATPEDFHLLSKARVLLGHESWGPMALAGGRLLVRDFTTLKCLDVREK